MITLLLFLEKMHHVKRFYDISFCIKAETEVKRLDELKTSKMKELFLRKQFELKDICSRSHMEIPSPSEMENITHLVDSGKR